MSQEILAVDDELHMLRLLEQIIREKTAYDIDTTHNALEVPERLEENQYKLIITDLCMPGLTGLDILKLVQERGRSEEVIIITAFGALETATEAFRLGAYDYILKPFRKDRLLVSIERVMRFQKCKTTGGFYDQLLGTEPYQLALDQFRRDYIFHLSHLTQGNIEEIARRSGLSIGEIEEVLRQC